MYLAVTLVTKPVMNDSQAPRAVGCLLYATTATSEPILAWFKNMVFSSGLKVNQTAPSRCCRFTLSVGALVFPSRSPYWIGEGVAVAGQLGDSLGAEDFTSVSGWNSCEESVIAVLLY